jgi:hypothetical protein
VSLGSPPASLSYNNNDWEYSGKKGKVTFTMYRKHVDTAYAGLYRLPLLAGRNLHPQRYGREFVINETTLKAMGLKHPSGGHRANHHGKRRQHDPHRGRGTGFSHPLVPRKDSARGIDDGKEDVGEISIRLASRHSADWPATLHHAGQVWQSIYPGETFAYQFYDQTIAQFYERERTVARVINLATGVAVLISCLGLFGLAAFTAGQRTKEIGIRKVLGASVTGIVALLSKDFIKLVGIALVLAAPLAWYAVQWWLADFAYRITPGWWMFGLAGTLALGIALLTVGYQSMKAALANPVDSLRNE